MAALPKGQLLPKVFEPVDKAIQRFKKNTEYILHFFTSHKWDRQYDQIVANFSKFLQQIFLQNYKQYFVTIWQFWKMSLTKNTLLWFIFEQNFIPELVTLEVRLNLKSYFLFF